MQDINASGQNRLLGRPRQTSSGEDIYGASEHTPSIELSTEDLSAVPQQSDPLSPISPPLYFSVSNNQAVRQNAELAAAARRTSPPTSDAANLLHELHVKTDLQHLRRRSSVGSGDVEPRLLSSASAASFTQRIPSVRSWLNSTAGSISPGSAISSPQIAAMMDITPLPSPNIAPLESWKGSARARSRASSTSSRADSLMPVSSNPGSALSLNSPRKKHYSGLNTQYRIKNDQNTNEEAGYARDRSISDYVPDQNTTPKPRKHAVSTSVPSLADDSTSNNIRREEFLAASRGIIPPSPPFASTFAPDQSPGDMYEEEDTGQPSTTNIYHAKNVSTGHESFYESLRLLGQGTFSKVFLAVRLFVNPQENVDGRGVGMITSGAHVRSRQLVAVKVVEPGPAGGADADRIEVSLKREVELMKLVHHPSIIHLKAFSRNDLGQALLVVNYCPSGDLFDLTSENLDVLTPALIRRIFAELASAVRYLHQRYIVHRDIKLENVLMNIPVQVYGNVLDWQKIGRAVVTLTDLGLGREIPKPPESPLLETRCGSEDYAAPEILMGSPYDGRQTDAWALGVLLYALMEGRLPFDALPGTRGDPATLKARTPHRVARCEWGWVKYGDEDFEWDPVKGKEVEGAKKVVEGLLKRNTKRTSLTEVREMPWVKDGISIDGGLRWVEEENI